MAKKLLKKNYTKQFSVLMVLTLLMSLFYYQTVSATGTLTSLSDTMSRIKTGVASDHTIRFTTPTGIANTNTVTLTFPSSSFTMGGSLSGVTIADDSGADNAVTSAIWSDPTLTITASSSSTVAAGHTATIKIPSEQITNPAAAATYIISIGGTFGDTGSFAVVIVADDQIPVTAGVDPTLTFTIANTTLALNTLSSGSISSAGPNEITIGTNGSGGYTISVKDIGNGSSPGLYNSPASKLIASATATPIVAGTEGYGGQCTKTGGSGSCAFADGSGNDVTGFALAGSTFASYGSKPSGIETYNIKVKATISTSTDAGAYTDTLTLIGTGNF